MVESEGNASHLIQLFMNTLDHMKLSLIKQPNVEAKQTKEELGALREFVDFHEKRHAILSNVTS